MPFRETLELLLNANASGGIAEVRRFASETGKSISAVESNFSKFGASALKFGGTGMAAGGFLTALGDKERQASEGLKASIQAAGQSYDEFEGKIEHAVKGQEKFGHTADETNNALSTLVSSFGDTEQAIDKLQLVADLAAKKHIGLADAATIVAKAHGGAARIFKEFNIQVGENADGTKNYDGALTALSGKLSGQASASVTGFTGHLKILATQAEDFIAGIGKDWGPAILGVSTGLTALGGISTGVGKGLDFLRARRIADTEATLAETGATEANTAAQLENKTAGSGLAGVLGKAGIAAAAAAATYALYQYGQSLNKTTLDQRDLNAVLHGSTEAADHALDAIMSMKGSFVDTDTILRQFADSGDAGIGVLKSYRDHLIANGKSTADVDKILGDAAASQANYNSNVAAGSTATADATKKDQDERKALQDLTAARQKDLDLVNSSIGGVIGLSNAQIAERRAIDDMTSSLRDSTQSQDDHRKAINDAETAIMQEANAAGELAAKQAEAAGVTDTATASTQAQIKELYGVMATLDPGSPLRQWLGDYIRQLQSVPSTISTDFNVYVNQITSSLSESASRLSRNTKQYASGGMVDGPRGKPQLAIVHGGEFVSTAGEVDAAKRGGTTWASTGAGSSFNFHEGSIQVVQAPGENAADTLPRELRTLAFLMAS